MKPEFETLAKQITQLFPREVYTEWKESQEEELFVANTLNWALHNHELLHEFYAHVKKTNDKVMPYVQFVERAYTIKTYHEMLDVEVKREIKQITIPFPFNP